MRETRDRDAGAWPDHRNITSDLLAFQQPRPPNIASGAVTPLLECTRPMTPQALRQGVDLVFAGDPIRSFSSNGTVSIEVSDRGPGLTPEQREHVFDPFYTTKTRSGIVDAPEIRLRPVSRTDSDWTDQIPLIHGWKTNLALAEKAMIVRALRMSAGNKSKAAEILAIHRRLVYEKMREYEIPESAPESR